MRAESGFLLQLLFITSLRHVLMLCHTHPYLYTGQEILHPYNINSQMDFHRFWFLVMAWLDLKIPAVCYI